MSIYYTYIFATEDYKLNKSNQNPLCHSNSSPNLHVLCLQTSKLGDVIHILAILTARQPRTWVGFK